MVTQKREGDPVNPDNLGKEKEKAAAAASVTCVLSESRSDFVVLIAGEA